MDRFDDQYVMALRSLSCALMVVAKLAEQGTQGADFNNEVLAKRLGSCWGKSIDEMASQIHEVADAMDKIRKQIDVWDSLIEENQLDGQKENDNMATFKEHLITERTKWRDTILEKFNAGEYHKALFLMACNCGEKGNIMEMIEHFCDNADPMDDWRRLV